MEIGKHNLIEEGGGGVIAIMLAYTSEKASYSVEIIKIIKKHIMQSILAVKLETLIIQGCFFQIYSPFTK